MKSYVAVTQGPIVRFDAKDAAAAKAWVEQYLPVKRTWALEWHKVNGAEWRCIVRNGAGRKINTVTLVTKARFQTFRKGRKGVNA